MSRRITGPGPNPSGLCMCGCGARTPIARQSIRATGDVFGTPMRYVQAHGNRLNDRLPEPNPGGLCMCGCGERTLLATESSRESGNVAGKPLRFINGHWSRLQSKGYIVDEENGCWVWQGYTENTGYGLHKSQLAHRAVYIQYCGPIPDGLHLHHRCRTRACVNPEHLEPVTPLEHKRLHREMAA